MCSQTFTNGMNYDRGPGSRDATEVGGLGPDLMDYGVPRRGLAGVRAGVLHLAGPGRLLRAALADDERRDQHDLPSVALAPEFRGQAQMAGIRADGLRLVRRPGRRAGDGLRPPTPPLPRRPGLR